MLMLDKRDNYIISTSLLFILLASSRSVILLWQLVPPHVYVGLYVTTDWFEEYSKSRGKLASQVLANLVKYDFEMLTRSTCSWKLLCISKSNRQIIWGILSIQVCQCFKFLKIKVFWKLRFIANFKKRFFAFRILSSIDVCLLIKRGCECDSRCRDVSLKRLNKKTFSLL